MSDGAGQAESPPTTGVVGEASDQQILAQKEAIAQEIAHRTRLVGPPEPLIALEREYGHDDKFLSKISHLRGRYTQLRRTRPDGNCFYRAVAFRYFELLAHPEGRADYERFRACLPQAQTDMVELGMPRFTVEDFYDHFLDSLDQVGQGQLDAQANLLMFNDQGQSDYLVVFLRLLTSMQLKKNADFYQNFLDEQRTVAEFCATEVEPMYHESDHIHITALNEATGIPIRVVYLDRGTHTEASVHDFPEGQAPLIHLLYRPGHYDVIYPKEPDPVV